MNIYNVEYKKLICDLLAKKQYPIISNYVIFDIYYKELNIKEPGIQYEKKNYTPEIIYEQNNNPYQLLFVSENKNYFAIHKRTFSNFSLSGLPIKCKRLKIYKNIINEVLNLKCVRFEEEIYHFLTCLNFNVPSIKTILDLNFIKCTNFMPLYIKMYIFEYTIKHLECKYTMPYSFGPNNNTLQVRLLEGRLSNCYLKTHIVSLRDHYSFQKYLDKALYPSFINNYHMYNIYYSVEHETYIPLAYNPFENPII